MAAAKEIVEMPAYVSDSETNTSEQEMGINVVEKKRKQRTWIKEMVFSNANKAEEAVKEADEWSYHYTNTTAQGKKKYFRCNKAKFRGEQCEACIYLLFVSTSDKVILFRSQSDHTHNRILGKIPPLSRVVREAINELFELKLKPKAIIEALHAREMPLPTIRQLNNYLKSVKTQKYGPVSISLGEMEQWCIESSKSIPEFDDTPFVISYQIKYQGENDDEIDHYDDIDDDDTIKFRFVVTTKRLLRIASKSTKIHADATYKLIWQGFPVLVLGTSDLDRHFHPFGMAVCSNEKTQDFIFVFRALQKGVETVGLGQMNPDILIADGADAIRNAFKHVFGEKPMVMCWAHMRRKIVKRVESTVDKSFQEDLLNDVDALQLAQSQRMFTKASKLFIKKWNKSQPSFVEYFRDEWLTSHDAWYEGVRHFTPSTNNGLESANRVIKDENTFRERLPLSRFKVLVFEIVGKWSKSYERGLKQYNDKQTISLDLWTNAYQWVKSEKSVLSTEINDSVEYYVPAGDETEVSHTDVDVVKKMKWYSFDQYKIKAFSVWCVSLPMDKFKWAEGVCNCPAFFKKFMCKHVIGLAIRLNLCKPPPAVKDVPIGEKRRRGRPSKAKKALLVQ